MNNKILDLLAKLTNCLLNQIWLWLWFFLIWFLIFPQPVEAKKGEVLGVHILNPHELDLVEELTETEKNQGKWHYVVIPLTLDDLEKEDVWAVFFEKAKDEKIIPIVRLASRYEHGAWKIPSKKDVVDLIDFLSSFEWPTDERYIIIFNEVNHANEWGGRLDPDSYNEVLKFASQWAHTEGKNYQVLPAAMDLAANNSSQTREAFAYLEQMYANDEEIFDYIDVWNSHSYPNPGFSSSPEGNGQNSISGFLYELDFLKEKTGKDFKVMITETGWVANDWTSRWLNDYYLFALQHVWSNPQVIAVTPFVLKGDPGPFAAFSFFDRNDQPTVQYEAYQYAIENL